MPQENVAAGIMHLLQMLINLGELTKNTFCNLSQTMFWSQAETSALSCRPLRVQLCGCGHWLAGRRLTPHLQEWTESAFLALVGWCSIQWSRPNKLVEVIVKSCCDGGVFGCGCGCSFCGGLLNIRAGRWQ
eukprot:gene10243-2399_t